MSQTGSCERETKVSEDLRHIEKVRWHRYICCITRVFAFSNRDGQAELDYLSEES